MRRFASILLLAAGPALAECPSAPDIDAAEAALYAEVQAAETEAAAREVAGRLWELWATAPDEAAQALLDTAMTARSSYDFVAAYEALDKLTAYCPDYAEGYNQRAFVSYLRQDFESALADLELALARHPTHAAALSGKALTLMGLGRQDEAQEVLREALGLNPWLPERGLLRKAPGTDL